MPNWKRVIVSGSNAALNSLEITTDLTASGLTYPTADGTESQSIITDGAGNLSFGNPSAGFVEIAVKNVSGGALTKGTPVFITGSVGASTTVEVDAADASDASKMPAVGVLSSDLANNGQGFATTAGFLKNIATDPIDGSTPNPNDTIYVKAGGGLTLTKPTGDTNLIQNIGKVGKVSGGNAGSIIVSSIMRSNDVPNLPEGKLWVGGTNYTVTSSAVHLDETNERLGIGTSSPAYTLDLKGENTAIRVWDNSDSVNSLFAVDNSGAFQGTFSNHPIRIFTNSSEKIRIAPSGDVGIGTTSPSEKLHVDGNAIVSGIGVGTSTLYSNSINIENTGTFRIGNTEFLSKSNNDLSIYQSKVNITSGGNVGIGTSSPSTKFHLEGGIARFDNASSNYLEIDGSDSSTNHAIISNRFNQLQLVTNTGAGDPHIALLPATGGNVGIGTSGPATNLMVYDTVSEDPAAPGSATTGMFALNSSGQATLSIGKNSGNTFWISNVNRAFAGPYYYDIALNPLGGDVGIGTTTPAEKLTVEGNISGSGDVNIVGDVTASAFVGDGSALTGITAEWDGSHNGDAEITGSLVVSGSGIGLTVTGNTTLEGDNRHLYFGSNNTFIGENSNSNKLELRGGGNSLAHTVFIDNTGQLGLGTSSPSEKLHVDGDTLISAEKYYYVAGGGAGFGSDASGNFKIRQNSADLIFGSGDNVGIGTSSPSAKLHVAGGIKLSDNEYLSWDNSSTRIVGQSGYMQIQVASTDIMRLTSGGNVGIGTTSPSEKLHITDSQGHTQKIQFGLDSIYNYIGVTSYDTLELSVDENNANGNSAIAFRLDGSERMRINTSGDVGIGTSSPAEKLTVEGNISGSGDVNIVGDVTASAFVGDGSALTNITAEWDGSHNGDAEITGSLIVSGSSVELEMFGDIQLRHTTEDAIKFGGAGDLYGESSANSVKLQKPGRSGYFLFGTHTGYFQVSDGTNSILLRAESTPEVTIYSTGALNYTQHSATNNNNGNVLTWSNTTSGNGERGRVSIVGDLRLDDYSSGTASNAVNIENNGDAYFSGSLGIGTTSPESKLHITDANPILIFEDTTNPNKNRIRNVDGSFIYDADYNSQMGNSRHRFNIDGSEKLRIESSGNVGIGTTSPSAKLHISGSSTGDTVLIENNEGSSDAAPVVTLYRNSTTPADGDYLGQFKFKGENDNGGEVTYAKITGKTSDVTNGTEDGLIETAVKKDGTNVIVSRQTGDALKLINGTGLEVDGTTTLGDLSLTDLTVSGTASIAYIDVQFVSSSIIYSSGSNIFGDADDDVQTLNGDMVVNDTDLFVDASTSRVGITTNTPAHTLDVDSGDIRVSQNGKFLLNNSNVGMYRSSNDLMLGGFGAIRFLSSATAMPSQTERMIIDGSTGNVGIGTSSPSEKLTVEGNISGSGTGSFESIAIPGTTTDYYIGGSGGGAATNELRIGSRTTPNNIALELYHSINPVSLGIGYNNGGGLAFIESVHGSYDTNTHMLFKPGGTETWRIGSHGSTASNKFQIQPADAANDFIIADNSSNAILYSDTSTQRIGIGTTSPSYKLHVSGTIYSATDGTDGGQIRLENTGGGSTWYWSARTTGLNLGELTVADGQMFIENGGNVGLGTTNPETALHIYRDNTSTSRMFMIDQDGTGDASMSFRLQGAQEYAVGIDNSDGNKFKISNSSGVGTNDLLTIDTSGNVGIGTTNPQAKLEVASGDLIINNSGGKIDFRDGSASSRYFLELANSNADLQINDRTGAGSVSMTIQSGGNVGIGTTSPSAKLDVEGDINVANANISNQENTDVDTGTEVVATLEIATYTAGFFDFVIKKGTNVRSGTIYACHDGTDVVHTETTTIDLGDTSDVELTIDISGGDMRLIATVLSDDWSIKSLVRGL